MDHSIVTMEQPKQFSKLSWSGNFEASGREEELRSVICR